jgi:nucleotide-binding universal stress UspA family protein
MGSDSNIKTVMVGLDFSNYSKIAVRQAQLLAKTLRAPIVYVHIFEDPFLWDWQRRMFDEELTKHYREEVFSVYALSKNANVVVKRGTPFKKLIQIADEYEDPLIVVGHKGNNNAVTQFFLGSTAERLSLKSPYPVWIHRGEKVFTPKKVVIPYDLTERSLNAIKAVHALNLETCDTEYFHVSQPAPVLDLPALRGPAIKQNLKHLESVQNFQRKHPDLKTSQSWEQDVAGAIDRKAKKSDLIAISPKRYRGVLSGFGSITSKVVRSGTTPVLVAP